MQLLYIGVDVARIRDLVGHPAVITYRQLAECATGLAKVRAAGTLPSSTPLNRVLVGIGDSNKGLRQMLAADGYTDDEISAAFDVAAGRCFIREG